MKSLRLAMMILSAAAVPAWGSTVYAVSIDASSLAANTSGFIDLAFNGGFPATAAVSGFSNAGGSLNAGSITTQGTVTGTLPGTVTLDNGNTDYDEGLVLGPIINFLLTLNGTPSGNTGDVFTLSFFNSTFDGALLTGNLNDFWLVQIQLDTRGGITPTAYANPSGGASFATVTALPEPGTFALVGLALVGLWRRARR